MSKKKRPEPIAGKYCGFPGHALQYLDDASNQKQIAEFVDAPHPHTSTSAVNVPVPMSFGVMAVAPGEWVFKPDDTDRDVLVVRKKRGANPFPNL